MDLYIVLGVTREATVADIKRAYRRLARRFHPDINPGDREAAARFRQILDAYETLTDPDRRRHYDQGGRGGVRDDAESFGFTGFDFSATTSGQAPTFGELFEEVFTRRTEQARAPAAARGTDLHRQAALSFEDAWRGGEWPVTITRHAVCRTCAGAGFNRTAESRCGSCEGSGVLRTVRGHMVFSKPCPPCGGSGRQHRQACAGCQGQGVEMRTETVVVHVPAGIADGARIRIAGMGHAGVRGQPPGDLLIDVAVQTHPRFERRGEELHVIVPVAVHEAALGAKIEIETPDGPARLRVPPGTQSGDRLRLRERGAPSPRGGARGDLVAEVRVMLPRVLDEHSKDLLREFGRLNPQSVRDDESGTPNGAPER